jgi:hypothetical protein
MTVPNPGWETSETGWLGIGTTEVTFTAESPLHDPDMTALFGGPEKPATRHAVQVDYQVPVKLSWWRRVWLWVRRKPHPTIQRRVTIPHATVALTEPED